MKDKRVEEILSKYKVYIDTCSLCEKSNGFFEFELIPLLKKNLKKIYVISNVKQELTKLSNIPAKANTALNGFNNLALLEANNLIELEDTKNSMHADGAFIDILYLERRKRDVCLITEDKDLALDVINNIKLLNSAKSNHDMKAIKINSGNPVIWTFDLLDEKLGVSDLPEFKIRMANQHPKLLINFVIDNSISMKGEKIENFRVAFKTLIDELSLGDLKRYVEYEIVAYEDFNPRVLKKFTDEEVNINLLTAGKIPFLGRAINLAIDDLEKRVNQLKEVETKLYKPWLIVLTDGQSFDDTNQVSDRIKVMNSYGDILFIPFALSTSDISDKLDSLSKLKFFIKVGENKYSYFIKWILELIVSRLTTPLNENVKIEKNSFDGWAILK